MTTNTTLKGYFETGDKPTQDQFYLLIDKLPECFYGSQNPPAVTQLSGLKCGDYYIQTSNGTSTGTEVQRALFNGVQLVEWTVTNAVWAGLNAGQKNAVKTFNVTS